MNLTVIAGKLLRAPSGALATLCRCCIPPPPPKYWCFTAGTDTCGNALYFCRQDDTGEGAHSGPFPDCSGRCPETPPCIPYWCYTNGTDACGQQLYTCRTDPSGAGAVSGPYLDCNGRCPETPPCAGGVCCIQDEYGFSGPTCSEAYSTQAACEECSPQYMCYDESTYEQWQVASCAECSGTGQYCYYSGSQGPCGTWVQASGCTPSPCPAPGACCVDGECVPVQSEAECGSLGGIYQGFGSTCEDGSCDDGCCQPGTCQQWDPVCVPGYFQSRCQQIGGSACDPNGPAPPATGARQCAGGPTTATITGVGHIVGNVGAQSPDDLAAQTAMNDSYAVQLNCFGGGSAVFERGNMRVLASVGVGQASYGSLDVRDARTDQRYCATAVSINNPISAITACGFPVYQCQNASNSPPITGVTTFCNAGNATLSITFA